MGLKSVVSDVDRVFKVIGLLFTFGGLYLGTLMFLQAPDVLELRGTIESVKVEKSRPLGFEDIPVDSTDPEHQNIPLNVITYATVSYEVNGRTYEGLINSWEEESSWEEGREIVLYYVEGEEDVPMNHFPSEAAGRKKSSLIAGGAMTVMGLILLTAGLASGIGRKKQGRILMEKIRRIKKQNWQPRLLYSSEVLYENLDRGNPFSGIILTVIGIGFLGGGLAGILSAGTLADRAYPVFPVLLGLGVIFLGTKEFYREEVKVNNKDVYVKYTSLWTRYEEKVPLSQFGGIKDILLIKQHGNLRTRRYLRYLVLIHEDFRFHELPLVFLKDDEESEEKIREVSGKLGLPLVEINGEDLRLIYPEQL